MHPTDTLIRANIIFVPHGEAAGKKVKSEFTKRFVQPISLIGFS
jgi:hypothetical protein